MICSTPIFIYVIIFLALILSIFMANYDLIMLYSNTIAFIITVLLMLFMCYYFDSNVGVWAISFVFLCILSLNSSSTIGLSIKTLF